MDWAFPPIAAKNQTVLYPIFRSYIDGVMFRRAAYRVLEAVKQLGQAPRHCQNIPKNHTFARSQSHFFTASSGRQPKCSNQALYQAMKYLVP